MALRWDKPETHETAGDRGGEFILVRKRRATIERERAYMREYMRRRRAAQRQAQAQQTAGGIACRNLRALPMPEEPPIQSS
jgi:hypothetical protein